MAALVRKKRSITTPEIAEAVINKRLARLQLTFQEYVASLIAYDCWAEKDHIYTGGGTKEDEEHLWKEIIADFGKPEKTGSYFSHRIHQIVEARLEEERLKRQRRKKKA